jgi:hypothetical protein
MKERGRYQIQFMKTRNSSGVGQKVDLEFDVDTLKINDLMEDDDTGSGFKKPGGSSIYENLKKTSTVVDQSTGEIKADPTEGVSIGKIKGVQGGSMVRQLLSNINPEKD